MLNKFASSTVRRWNDAKSTLIFVHIGKCGGASVVRALQESPVVKKEFKRVIKSHIEKPPIMKHAQYMVVVRNPIQRAISAFNWRYKLVVNEAVQKDRFQGEYDILRRYGTINNLAQSLYKEGKPVSCSVQDFNTIHHLNESISFYLNELLLSIDKSQLRWVLAKETLDTDIFSMLGVSNSYRVHEHGKHLEGDQKYLSREAYRNLRCFLKADYDALDSLLNICHNTHCSRDVLLR